MKVLKKSLSLILLAVIFFTFSSSEIKVIADEINSGALITYGDVNGDGFINSFDSLILSRHLCNNTVQINPEASDLDGNGLINNNDLILLDQYIVKGIDDFNANTKDKIKGFRREIVYKYQNDDITIALTNEMAELADSLNTPSAVYEYLKNNISSEFYSGSRKGAIGTFEQKSGNDIDNASLFISMLRYLGYDADYTKCNVLFTENQLLELTRTKDINAAMNTYNAQNLNISETEAYGKKYYKAQRHFTVLRIDNTEYYLDTSFKAYETTASIYNNLDSLDINEEEIISSLRNGDFQGFTEISENLEKYNQEAVISKYKIKQENTNTLPEQLPYLIDGKIEILKNVLDLMDKVTVTLGNDIISFSTTFLEVYSIKLEYVPFNILDIDFNPNTTKTVFDIQAGDRYTRLVPVLRLGNGQYVSLLKDMTELGNTQTITIGFNGQTYNYSFQSEVVAGGMYSIAFNMGTISKQQLYTAAKDMPLDMNQNTLTDKNIYSHKNLGSLLYFMSLAYYSQYDISSYSLAEYSNVNKSRYSSVLISGFEPEITENILGFYSANKRGTFNFDVIGNYTVETSRINDDDQLRTFNKADGYMSSVLESEVIEQFTGIKSVSAVNILEEAALEGIEIMFFNGTNINDVDSLKISSEDKAQIKGFIEDGFNITVPESNISINNWTGTGFIAESPDTGAAYYMINTNLNGGCSTGWAVLTAVVNSALYAVESLECFQLILLGATMIASGGFILGGASIALGSFLLYLTADYMNDTTEMIFEYMETGDNENELIFRTTLNLAFPIIGAGISKSAGHIGQKLYKSKLVQKYGTKVYKAINKADAKILEMWKWASRGSAKGYSDDLIRIMLKDSKCIKYSDDLVIAIGKHSNDEVEKIVTLLSNKNDDIIMTLNLCGKNLDEALNQVVKRDNYFDKCLEEATKYGDNAVLELLKRVSREGEFTQPKLSNSLVGFTDNIDDVLKANKLTLDSFNELRLKPIKDYTNQEAALMKNIRESVTFPDETTLMSKVIPGQDINKYLNGDYYQVSGFVSKAEDTRHLKTYMDMYESLGLNYPDTKYKPSTDNSLGLIKFKTEKTNMLEIPYGASMGGNCTDSYPFLGNGFTIGENGNIIPEYSFKKNINGNPIRVNILDGAELYKVTQEGDEILMGVFNEKKEKFIRLEDFN